MPVKNALFCFPCLLFGGEDVWIKTVMTYVYHLPDYIKKHKNSAYHKNNALKLKGLWLCKCGCMAR